MCTVMIITVHLGSGLLKFRLKKMTLITVKCTVTFFSSSPFMKSGGQSSLVNGGDMLDAVFLKIMQYSGFGFQKILG